MSTFNNTLIKHLAEQRGVKVATLIIDGNQRWASLHTLSGMGKECWPLEVWSDALSYLFGCPLKFGCYQEIENSLKPFRLEVK